MALGNADTSKFLVGSNELKFTPFFAKTFTIPGITFSHPSMATRSGVKLHLGADSMDFDTLEFEVLLDGKYDVYFEIMEKVFQEVDWDNNSFAQIEFNLWVLVFAPDGKPLFRVDFHNCRFNSIGALTLDPSAEPGTSVPVSVSYDYYTWTRNITCVNECAVVADENGNPIKTDQIVYDVHEVERYYRPNSLKSSFTRK